MQTLLGCSTTSARKKRYYEKDIPLHYTSYHFSSSFLYPTAETIYYEFVTEFKSFLLTRILGYCVGMSAERSLVQTTVREGVSIFNCFWPTRHAYLTSYQSHLPWQSSSDKSFLPTKDLIPSDMQGFCPSQKTFKNSQLQVMLEGIRV